MSAVQNAGRRVLRAEPDSRLADQARTHGKRAAELHGRDAEGAAFHLGQALAFWRMYREAVGR